MPETVDWAKALAKKLQSSRQNKDTVDWADQLSGKIRTNTTVETAVDSDWATALSNKIQSQEEKVIDQPTQKPRLFGAPPLVTAEPSSTAINRTDLVEPADPAFQEATELISMANKPKLTKQEAAEVVAKYHEWQSKYTPDARSPLPLTINQIEENPEAVTEFLTLLMPQKYAIHKQDVSDLGEFTNRVIDTASNVATFGLIDSRKRLYERLREKYGDYVSSEVARQRESKLGFKTQFTADLLGGMIGFILPSKAIGALGNVALRLGAKAASPLIRGIKSYETVAKTLGTAEKFIANNPEISNIITLPKQVATNPLLKEGYKLGAEGLAYGTIAGTAQNIQKGDPLLKGVPKKAIEEAENFLMWGYLFKTIGLGRKGAEAVIKKLLATSEKNLAKSYLKNTIESLDIDKTFKNDLLRAVDRLNPKETARALDDMLRATKEGNAKEINEVINNHLINRGLNPNTLKEIKPEVTRDVKEGQGRLDRVEREREKIEQGLPEQGRRIEKTEADRILQTPKEETTQEIISVVPEPGVKSPYNTVNKIVSDLYNNGILAKEDVTHLRYRVRNIVKSKELTASEKLERMQRVIESVSKKKLDRDLREIIPEFEFKKSDKITTGVVRKFINKYWEKNIPRSYREFVIREAINKVNSLSLQIKNTRNQLESKIKEYIKEFEDPKQAREMLLQDLNNYFHGELDVIQLPEAVRPHARAFRSLVDKYSDMLSEELFGTKVSAKIEMNKGKYVTRLYMKFLDPHFKAKPEIKEHAKKLIKGEVENIYNAQKLFDNPTKKKFMQEFGITDIKDLLELSDVEFKELQNAYIERAKTPKQAESMKLELQEIREDGVKFLEDLDNVVDAMVEGIAEHPMGRKVVEGKVHSIVETSILKKRKDIDAVIKELMGEVKDPFLNIELTLLKQGQLLYQKQAFDKVYLVNDNLPLQDVRRFVYNEPYTNPQTGVKFTEKLPDTPRWGALAGKYTTREIAEALVKEASEMDNISKWFAKLNYSMRWMATAGNLRSYPRNFHANGLISFAADYPVYRPKYWKLMGQNFNLLWDRLMLQSGKPIENWKLEKIREWQEVGLLGTGGYSGELLKVKEDIRRIADNINNGDYAGANAILAKLEKSVRKGGKGVSNASGFLSELYGMMDDIWKVTNYEWDVMNIKPSDVAARKKIADRVNNVMPDYSQLPEFVRKLRTQPYISTFPSFSIAVTKAGHNLIKETIENGIFNKNPEMRLRAIRQMFKIPMTVAAHTNILSNFFTNKGLFLRATGYDKEMSEGDPRKGKKGVINNPELAKALDRMVFSYDENEQKIVIYEGDGDYRYYVYSYLLPYKQSLQGALMKGLYLAGKEKDPYRTWEILKEDFLQPILGESIFTQAGVSLLVNASNRPEFRDYKHIKEFKNLMLKLGGLEKSGGDLAKALTPGTIKDIQRFARNVERGVYTEGKDFNNALREEGEKYVISGLTGIRQSNVNIEDLARMKFSDAKHTINLLDSDLAGALNQAKNLDDVKNAIKDNFVQYMAKAKDIKQISKDAKTLGLKQDRLLLLYNDYNFPRDIVNYSISGKDDIVVYSRLLRNYQKAIRSKITEHLKRNPDIREIATLQELTKQGILNRIIDEAYKEVRESLKEEVE